MYIYIKMCNMFSVFNSIFVWTLGNLLLCVIVSCWIIHQCNIFSFVSGLSFMVFIYAVILNTFFENYYCKLFSFIVIHESWISLVTNVKINIHNWLSHGRNGQQTMRQEGKLKILCCMDITVSIFFFIVYVGNKLRQWKLLTFMSLCENKI